MSNIVYHGNMSWFTRLGILFLQYVYENDRVYTMINMMLGKSTLANLTGHFKLRFCCEAQTTALCFSFCMTYSAKVIHVSSNLVNLEM